MDFEALGRRLREDLPIAEAGARYSQRRLQLIQAVEQRRAGKVRRTTLAMGFAAATVAIALVLWIGVFARTLGNDSERLAFHVGDANEPGKVGAYYAPSAERALPLRFEDGSTIEIAQRSGLRVSRADRAKTALLLETGTARFDIVPRPNATWEIAAGPYLVHVTGTSFSLSWDAESRLLELEMRSGSVLVSGPGLEGGHRVSGTERFAARVTAERDPRGGERAADRHETPPAEAAEASAALEASPLAETPEPNAEAPSAPAGKAAPAKGAPSTATGTTSDYPSRDARGSAQRLRARAIVEAAERRGIDTFLASASAEELRSLADAARFTGRFDLSRRALVALRTRFPGTRAAAGSAFLLGRLADDAGAPSQAIEWYDRELAEGGPLAAEALGRKLIALHRLGRTNEARALAGDYLRRFPDGPYAPQARDLSLR